MGVPLYFLIGLNKSLTLKNVAVGAGLPLNGTLTRNGSPSLHFTSDVNGSNIMRGAPESKDYH